MFTVDQIREAHAKVKSGADFPAYIQALKQLGVTYYETFVTDGHSDYSGADDYRISSVTKYEPLQIARECNPGLFKADLKVHQQGGSDYYTFSMQAAAAGIEKWAVCLEQMTCTYYDTKGNIVLVEEIPG